MFQLKAISYVSFSERPVPYSIRFIGCRRGTIENPDSNQPGSGGGISELSGYCFSEGSNADS